MKDRGFTLVELLVVVAMIGILASLAIVGYKRFIGSAKSSEAAAILSSIRIAEESYRADTMGYLSCSADLDAGWYPSEPNGRKRHWLSPSHPEYGCWRMLNVVTDSPTRYGFTVVAGTAGETMPVPAAAATPTWPNPTTEPWYVAQASGDNDEDGVLSLFLTSSINGEIYSENTDE